MCCRAGPAKFRPSYVPEAADKIDAQGIDKFETSAHDTAIAQENVTYGLIKRERKDGSEPEAQPAPAPLTEAEALKRDLKDLPSEASLDAYEAMPVESFGEALLRGMGWSEGRAIGRGAKEEVTAKELVRRPHRLGLGAAPAPEPATHKKYIKPGETREGQDMVYMDSTGNVKSSKPVHAALVDRRKLGVFPGKLMRVVAGRHSGLQCEVQALEPREEGRSERARVRLLPSYEVVVVRCSELDEPGSNGKRSERDKEGDRRDSKRRRDKSPGDKDRSGAAKGESRREEVKEERPWLAQNIRVKIVDKRVGKGRFYLKKGTVVDVKTPTVCDVFVDDINESVLVRVVVSMTCLQRITPAMLPLLFERLSCFFKHAFISASVMLTLFLSFLLQDLRQSQLETVVPGTEGTPVLVLRGRHLRRRGRLLQRNTRTGLAAVQLGGDPDIHKFDLDDIAEFVGPMDGWDE